MANHRFQSASAAFMLLAVVLSACTTLQEERLDTSGTPQAGEWSAIASAALAQAEQLAQLADQSAPGDSVDLRLRAADKFLLAARYDRANNQLARLATNELSKNNQVRLETIRSRMQLPPASRNEQELAADMASQQLAQRAGRLAVAGYSLQAIKLRVLRDVLLSDADEKKRNDNAIWSLVRQQNTSALATLPERATDELVSWWSLGYLQATTEPAQLAAAYRWWQQRYPGYASDNAVFVGLTQQDSTNPALADAGPMIGESNIAALAVNPSKVALLLPLTGRYSPAAQAIEAGFRAADQAAATAPLDLQLVDSEAGDVLQSYDEAVANGAELVIGPLRKPMVNRLLGRGYVSSTVLTLNEPSSEPAPNAPNAPTQPSEAGMAESTAASDPLNDAMNELLATQLPPGVVVFGLSPEQEARSVARQAIMSGKTRAALLLPANDWGSRVGAAFADEFVNNGGLVIADGTYRPGVTDLGRDVAQLLGANTRSPLWRDIGGFSSANRSVYEGKERQQQRWSEEDQQIDMVFMAAFPRDARILRPSLKFHEAIRLPVYATSHVYSGRPNPKFDKDLDGVVFCDMPELLKAAEPVDVAADPALRRYPPRLVALGRDARLLVDNLALLQADPLSQLQGATGVLTYADDHIMRKLSCATFVDGAVQPLPELPAAMPMGSDGPANDFGLSQPF